MLPPVFQVLKASAGVKAFVGTNPPRIFRHGEAPQGVEKPYVTWFMVVGTPENHLSGLPLMDYFQTQVDVWHTTDAGVTLLAQEVRDAIEPYAHMTSMPIDNRDPDTLLYRIAMVFDWFINR